MARARLAVCEADLLDSLYDASFEPKGWGVFVRGLEQFLGGGVGMLSLPAPSLYEPGLVVAPSLDPASVESYRSRHFRTDPWLREAGHLPIGTVITRAGSVGREPLLKTAFYNEWMAPQGLLAIGQIGGVVGRGPHGLSLITLFRRIDTRPAAGAADCLRELMAHLRRASRASLEHTRLHAERTALAAALDHLPLALIVVDRQHRVQLSNRCGDGLVARRDGLILDREGLHATRPEDNLKLRRAVSDVCSRARGSRDSAAVSIARASGRAPLRASVLRVPATEGGGPGASMALLFVGDPDAEVELPASALSRLYGLTLAESALVRELANGRSIQEAAVRLGVTTGTARQRLVQIFDKTGTGRQASLVRLVLTGPESLRVGP